MHCQESAHTESIYRRLFRYPQYVRRWHRHAVSDHKNSGKDLLCVHSNITSYGDLTLEGEFGAAKVSTKLRRDYSIRTYNIDCPQGHPRGAIQHNIMRMYHNI